MLSLVNKVLLESGQGLCMWSVSNCIICPELMVEHVVSSHYHDGVWMLLSHGYFVNVNDSSGLLRHIFQAAVFVSSLSCECAAVCQSGFSGAGLVASLPLFTILHDLCLLLFVWLLQNAKVMTFSLSLQSFLDKNLIETEETISRLMHLIYCLAKIHNLNLLAQQTILYSAFYMALGGL